MLMKGIIRMLIMALAVSVSLPLMAVADAETDHRAGLNLNGFGDGYSLSASYHYRVCNYVALGGSIGFWSDGAAVELLDMIFDDPGEPPYSPYRYWGEGRRFAGFLEPSVLLSSPILHIGSCGLGLTAIPSVRFSTTRHGYTGFMENGSWQNVRYRCSNISFGIQCGPTFYAGPLAITVGYMASTIDTFREYTSRHHYVRHTAQGLFLDVGFYF